MKAQHHNFRMRDPGGPPLGLGQMSARDRYRYARSLERFRNRHGEPVPLMRGEVGQILGFVIRTTA
ncbi:MAG: hypothetical protein Q8N17_26155 [Burkholderiaceae bacterium]|nr:hypothetical protein [Burkholderiaceae bacterium]